MSEHEIVTIEKVDEPTLRISRAALDQHVKLGWKHVPTVVEKVTEVVTGKSVEQQDLAKDTKLSLKK